MTHTTLPSAKGQITIPVDLREKYKISKNTPLIIKDKGKGIMTIQVMNLIEHDAVQYYKNKKAFGLHFKHGIDPQALIDTINKIDG